LLFVAARMPRAKRQRRKRLLAAFCCEAMPRVRSRCRAYGNRMLTERDAAARRLASEKSDAAEARHVELNTVSKRYAFAVQTVYVARALKDASANREKEYRAVRKEIHIEEDARNAREKHCARFQRCHGCSYRCADRRCYSYAALLPVLPAKPLRSQNNMR